MIKIVREILVLPLKLLLLINRFIPVVDHYTMAKHIWKISRDVNYGCLLVDMTMYGSGKGTGDSEAAWVLANEVLQETKSARAMEEWASREISNRNYTAADECISLAQQAGCKDMHHLLVIKLYCSRHLEKYNRKEIIEEMLSCNWLSMEHTREALFAKADLAYDDGDYETAEEIANHVLSVKEDAQARYYKGLVYLGRDQDEMARSQFLMAKGDLPEKFYYASIGMVYIDHGRKQEGMEWFYEAVNAGLKNSDVFDDFRKLLESKEFADYCAARN